MITSVYFFHFNFCINKTMAQKIYIGFFDLKITNKITHMHKRNNIDLHTVRDRSYTEFLTGLHR